MQTNGLVKQQKQVELTKHHGSYMLSVYIKDCTSLEEIQCLKQLIKFKMTTKTCLCLNFPNNSLKFPNRKKFNLLEDILKKVMIFKMPGLKCLLFLTKQI